MACGAVWDAWGHGSLASLLQHLHGSPQNPSPSLCPLLLWGRKVAFRTQWDGWREPQPQGFTDCSLMNLGQGDGEELGSPALGVVTQSWHHPNIPDPPFDPLSWTQRCPVQDSAFQGFSGSWHWAVAGRKETPKLPELGFASSVRTGVAGAVPTHLFDLVVFAKMGETPRQRLWLRGAQIFGSLRAGQNPLKSQ